MTPVAVDVNIDDAQTIPKELALTYIQSLPKLWNPIMNRDYKIDYVKWNSSTNIPYEDLEIVVNYVEMQGYLIFLCKKGKTDALTTNLAAIAHLDEKSFDKSGKKVVNALLSLGAQKRPVLNTR